MNRTWLNLSTFSLNINRIFSDYILGFNIKKIHLKTFPNLFQNKIKPNLEFTNSSGNRRVWTANPLHTMQLSNPLGQRLVLWSSVLDNWIVCKRFAVQTLLSSLQFGLKLKYLKLKFRQNLKHLFYKYLLRNISFTKLSHMHIIFLEIQRK